jgi:hypothetical protein
MYFIFAPSIAALAIVLVVQLKDHFLAPRQKPMLDQIADAQYEQSTAAYQINLARSI